MTADMLERGEGEKYTRLNALLISRHRLSTIKESLDVCINNARIRGLDDGAYIASKGIRLAVAESMRLGDALLALDRKIFMQLGADEDAREKAP